MMNDVRKIKIEDDDAIEIKPISVEIKEEEIELKTVEFNRKTILRLFREEYEYRRILRGDSIFAITNIIYIGKKGITKLDNALMYISWNAQWRSIFNLVRALSRYKAARIIAENYEAMDLVIRGVDIGDMRTPWIVLFHDDVIYIAKYSTVLIWMPGLPTDIYYNATSDELATSDSVSDILKTILSEDVKVYENLYDAIEDEMARNILFDDNKRLVLEYDLL